MPNSLPIYNNSTSVPPRQDSEFMAGNQIHFDNKENVEEQKEFSFACNDLKGALIFADEIFDNGKIRPSFASFDQSIVLTTIFDDNTLPLQQPLRKLLAIEQPNNFSFQSKGISKISCNEISPKVTMVEVGASNNKCKKSKSTGFSKTCKFRKYIKRRTTSEGQDTFVFLNPSGSMPMSSYDAKVQDVFSNKEKGEKIQTTLSPHEKFYVMNRKRTENSKQKSFLPYRQNLIGFFTNKNRFSKNVNPF
uniref:Uncharacterized protein n=1 Tax=Cajanus cajan TaxID=3821 RepID=A0A151SJE5_CAJCA|nr:hypothetical protein KK1_001109 [Cajanus cajan]